jgi:hypothetical protein
MFEFMDDGFDENTNPWIALSGNLASTPLNAGLAYLGDGVWTVNQIGTDPIREKSGLAVSEASVSDKTY